MQKAQPWFGLSATLSAHRTQDIVVLPIVDGVDSEPDIRDNIPWKGVRDDELHKRTPRMRSRTSTCCPRVNVSAGLRGFRTRRSALACQHRAQRTQSNAESMLLINAPGVQPHRMPSLYYALVQTGLRNLQRHTRNTTGPCSIRLRYSPVA
jgi:hypothetical protein